ncbi:kinase-like protein [Auricularia subglabra TFB-10046 SS5]|nr:kinase-like protein [Auricularia subglabra TFB-10046 SS5]
MSTPNAASPIPLFRGKAIPDSVFLIDTFKPVPGKRPITTGGYGTVQISQSVSDPSRVVVIKSMRYSENESLNEEIDKILVKEITPMLLAYTHRNILEFKGLIREPLGIVSAYIENGTLANHLPKIQLAARPQVLRDVAEGLNYLHTPRTIEGVGGNLVVAHGDLHPGNVLIKSDGTAVLCDFGLCKLAESGGLTSASLRRDGPAGVAAYVAPEMHDAKPPPSSGDPYTGRRTVMSDVFAFGMLIFTTLGGSIEASLGPNSVAIANKLINSHRPIREHITAQIDEKYWTMMMGNPSQDLSHHGKRRIERSVRFLERTVFL